MPQRSIAQDKQREFFTDLSHMDAMALTTKNGDSCALNIHGSFELFDKHWQTKDDSPNETMLALKQNTPTPPTSEPAVHVHINWQEVKWARIQPRHLKLINTDYEIVLCYEQDSSTRIFWFYLREGIDTQLLRAKWGDDWISLLEENNSVPKYDNRENVQIIDELTF